MAANIHEEFLRLVAFSDDEIKEVMPGWRNAAEKLELSTGDVEFATQQWIPANWDLTSWGTRKMMGAYIREIIDLCYATEYKKNGTKIIYGILPAESLSYYAIKFAGGDKAYVSFPDIIMVYVLNGFFHKIEPLLVDAETKGGVVYGCRHCALNKTRIAACRRNIIPSPDITWTWGFNCDEGPKTDEYINCYITPDWNYEITRVPHDTHFGELDYNNVERVEYLAEQIKLSMVNVEKATGIVVTPEAMGQAVQAWGRLAMKLGNFQNLMCNPDPVTHQGSLLHLVQNPIGVPFNTGFKYIEEAVDILAKEAIQRARQGVGVTAKGAPKLGSYFVPAAVPWVNQIFQENGVAMTFSLVTSISKLMMQPPSYQDPWMAAAESWLRMSLGMNLGCEVEDAIGKVEGFKPDAMLMGFFDFDRWLGAHQKMLSKLVEERTGIPHFYLESDFWEDRDYSPEALRTRIESISQVLKMKKLEKSGALA
jgi:hypothetical protein